jgi:hypothetical protein
MVYNPLCYFTNATFRVSSTFDEFCEKRRNDVLEQEISFCRGFESYLSFEGCAFYENFRDHKLKIRKFHVKEFREGSQNTKIIRFLTEHPNVLFDEKHVPDFGKNDRFDTIILGAFSGDDEMLRRIYLCYFECGSNHAMCKSLICWPKKLCPTSFSAIDSGKVMECHPLE